MYTSWWRVTSRNGAAFRWAKKLALSSLCSDTVDACMKYVEMDMFAMLWSRCTELKRCTCTRLNGRPCLAVKGVVFYSAMPHVGDCHPIFKRNGNSHRHSANHLSDALICTAALCTVITHSLLCRAADNQSQYLIYITWSLAAISNYESVVRWR